MPATESIAEWGIHKLAFAIRNSDGTYETPVMHPGAINLNVASGNSTDNALSADDGRYYGGGMMPAPEQDRFGDGKCSLVLFHGSGKLKTLMVFPSIFKGEHINHKKYVSVFSGKEITVKYDEPKPLQVDGETILGITECTAKAYEKESVKA